MGKCGPSRANFPNDQGLVHDVQKMYNNVFKSTKPERER